MRPRVAFPLLIAASLSALIGLGPDASAQTAGTSASVAASVSPETPERRKKEFIERSRIQIRSTVTANRREVTEEEREVIRTYWRRAMRLLRVRGPE